MVSNMIDVLIECSNEAGGIACPVDAAPGLGDVVTFYTED